MSFEGKRIIKRFGGNKLYDTVLKKPASWKDIYALIHAGENVVVLEAKTMKDITEDMLSMWLVRAQARGKMLNIDDLRPVFVDRGKKLAQAIANESRGHAT